VTGYLVEKSLAVDNIFVISMIFTFFAVPALYQHRVLFWGILGALLLRGAMIAVGARMIQEFAWIIYVFGGFLVLTGIKMLLLKEGGTDPNRNLVVRATRKLFPVTARFHGEHFFVRAGTDASHEAETPGAAVLPDPVVDSAKAGVLLATPLLLGLVMVEFTDLVFAVDSIPAIFAVTQDPFLVFTSNVFAILGLRNLYFAIAPLLNRFKYLKQSLVFILAFVGVKMILAHTQPIPTVTSLAVIIGILAVGILASAFAAGRETAPLVSPLASDRETLTRVTLAAGRKIIALALGSTVMILGVAALVLPRPAAILVPFSLVVLTAEILWARRLLNRLRAEVRSVAGSSGLSRLE
jgi:tellurite resistance protein TerC